MDEKTILNQHEERFDKTVEKNAFSEFFKEQLKNLNKKSPRRITKKDIAQKLGITDEMFRKIVNKEKPTKKRDCIIAICIALDLQTSETNEGLKAYGFNEELDQENDRDLLIMETIDQNGYDHVSNDIDKINEALRKSFLPELDIINHRKEVPKPIKRNYPYKLIKKWVNTYCESSLPTSYDKYKLKLLYNFRKYDRYKPLKTRYLNDCSVEAGMELMDKNKRLVLKVYSSEELFLKVYTDSKYIPFQQQNPSLEETGELRECFEELLEKARNEIRKTDLIYKDTKNFGHRISAKVIDNDLHVFIERYNHEIPVRNEYYLMDYCNGQYTMSVSHDSGFMRKYLSKEEYEKMYGLVPYKLIKEYKTLEDIEYSQVTSEQDDENYHYHGLGYSLYRWRCNYYRNMKKEIDEFIKMLKKGKEYIESPEIYHKFRNDVIEFFGVEKEFECQYAPNKVNIEVKKNMVEMYDNAMDVDSSFDFDAEYERLKNSSLNDEEKNNFQFNDLYDLEKSYYKLKIKQGAKIEDMFYYYDYGGKYDQSIVMVNNPKPKFTLSDGQEVELSVQDLIDGAKLGLTTVEEVGSVKLKHGSLKIKDLL